MDGAFLSGFMLFAALFFVALNGVFVLAEFSFATIRGTQVERLVNEGRASADIVREATRKLDEYLAVCQLGITISSLSLGALGEPAIADLIEPMFETWGVPEGLVHPVAFAIGFLIITSLHVVLGELVPKSVGIARPENSSLFIAPAMKFFYYLFLPMMFVFNGAGNAIVRAFGIPPASEKGETHTEEEVRMIIAQSTRRGTLEKSDERMLEGVFKLGEKTVREAMSPRPNVAALPAGTPLSELARVVSRGNYTRYPLHEDSGPDRVVGVVHARDVLRAAEAARSFEEDISARDLMREFVTVPENRLLEDVLADFRRRKVHMAVVVDEWGAFEGIVTIEDVLEEIVGDIEDEFDEPPLASDGAPRVVRISSCGKRQSSGGGRDRRGRFGRRLEASLSDDLAIIAEVEALLEEETNAEVRLVFDPEARLMLGARGASSSKGPERSAGDHTRRSLLALLMKRGLGVAVCDNTLKVWRPRGARALRGSRANAGVRHARRRRKPQ